MHPSIGFHQGFEVYESHDEIAEGGPEGIFSDALGWLEGVQDRPYFLFVHTYEAHTPYTHTSVADPRQSGRIGVSFDYEDLAAVRQGELVMTAGERQYVEDLYDGDVAYADQALGRFLHQVDEITSLDKIIVVVFSDHGEDLWDHVPERSPDHGHSLYEELLMVPLIVRAPSVVAAGLRVQTPVSLLDVAPTLLSLLGMQPDGQYRGRDLSVTLRDGVEPAELPVFAESVHYGPDRFSVRRGRLKVIVTPYPRGAHSNVRLQVAPLEIFDLAADPLERNNLGDYLEVPSGLLGALTGRALRFARPAEAEESPIADFPEVPLEQLRALGYLD
jgi:arylsulfatase A-like enzyme